MPTPLVFVDLETTGGSATADRITEIGIVEVSEAGVTEWSTLINPEAPISDFIGQITGINNRMVEGAPTFDTVAQEVLARLQGRLFIAHNASFDSRFLMHAFHRSGITFNPTVLCTVKLSRRLYPTHVRHNLDSLIVRHRLDVSRRHRALGDAQLIWQFWQRVEAEFGAEKLTATARALTARRSLPPAARQSA